MRDRVRRGLQPFFALLRQGMAPRRLALCVAIGIVVGNIPLFGTSTLLCAAIAIVARLNLPAIQLAQAAMAPTQLLLIVPFVRLGEWLTGAPHLPLRLPAGGDWIAGGALHQAASALWQALMHATLAFVLVAPVAVAVL